MFGKTDKSKREITTLLGADTRITGDVEFTGGLHVDGTVVGNIVALQDGTDEAVVSVSEDGVVKGNVHAPEVVLQGTVEGDVTATRRVELGATARVVGNVIYSLIEMAIGAEVNGKLVHEKLAAAGATTPAEPQAEPSTGDAAEAGTSADEVDKVTP